MSLVAATPQDERVLERAEPIAAGLGLDVVRVRIGGGARPQIQIMLDRAGGELATIDDCARFSRALSADFELDDPLPDSAYVLEVSTPGIDRPLTRAGDFARWTGERARLELAVPHEGRRRFSGTLLGEDERGIHLELDDDSVLTARIGELSKARLELTDGLIARSREAAALPPLPGEFSRGKNKGGRPGKAGAKGKPAPGRDPGQDNDTPPEGTGGSA